MQIKPDASPARFSDHALAPAESPDAPDVWFEAQDCVDLDEQWFDAPETLSCNDPIVEAPEIAITEDCRRSVIQLMRLWGEISQQDMIAVGLSKLLPNAPYELLFAATNAYSALRQGRNVDLALAGALGLASSCLGPGNLIAELARRVRQTIAEYLGEPRGYDGSSGLTDHDSYAPIYTAFATLLIVARHWLEDEGAPQRPILRIPTYLSRMLMRAYAYWAQLTRIAGHAAPVPVQHPTPASTPAILAISEMTLTHLPDAPLARATAAAAANDSATFESLANLARVDRFVFNATLDRDRMLVATVPIPAVSARPASGDIAHALHSRALRAFLRSEGQPRLGECRTRTSSQHRRSGSGMVRDTRLETRCEAFAASRPNVERTLTRVVRPAPTDAPSSHGHACASPWTLLPGAHALNEPPTGQATQDAINLMLATASACGASNVPTPALERQVDAAITRLQVSPLAPGPYRKGILNELVSFASCIHHPGIRSRVLALLAGLVTQVDVDALSQTTLPPQCGLMRYEAFARQQIDRIIDEFRRAGGRDRFGNHAALVEETKESAFRQRQAMTPEECHSRLLIPSAACMKALINYDTLGRWQQNYRPFLDELLQAEQLGTHWHAAERIERLQNVSRQLTALLSQPAATGQRLNLHFHTGYTLIALLAYVRAEIDLATKSQPIANGKVIASDLADLCRKLGVASEPAPSAPTQAPSTAPVQEAASPPLRNAQRDPNPLLSPPQFDRAMRQIIKARWTDRDFLIDKLEQHERSIQSGILKEKESAHPDQDLIQALSERLTIIAEAKITILARVSLSSKAQAFNTVFPMPSNDRMSAFRTCWMAPIRSRTSNTFKTWPTRPHQTSRGFSTQR